MATHSRTIVEVVAITATISVILAGIVFYLIYRLRLARGADGGKRASSFRREFPPPVDLRQRGAALKGVIVDEEGMDVLYLRKLESGCFSKVWYNPMMEEEEITEQTEYSFWTIRVDDELMEALFGYTDQKPSERNKNSSSIAAPSTQIFILHPRKSQNTAIVIKSLQISRREIVEAAMEGRGLNAETLEKLTKICPTQEETTKILQFTGDPAKLADAEAFLHHILREIPSAFVRFNAMLFRESYEPEILHLKESLQTCELGCNELRSGGVFFKFLEAILKAGNRLNAGTNWGNAQGFNLTSLRRLSDVKSADGKTTLLHFVVEQVAKSEGKRKGEETEMEERESLMLGLPAVEALNAEFCNVKRAARVDYEGLTGTCEALAARVDEIKRLLRRGDGGEVGRFAAEMWGFLEGCEEELIVVREEERRVVELMRKTNVYYQTGVKGGNPLQLFVMVKDFLESVDRVCGEIRKKLEKKRGGASPPLSPTPRSPVRFQNLQNYFATQRLGTSSDSDDDF
ncbi:hypothetical protein SASPL_138570 [Salvia splendens]|uniref:Formin-like protein n=1 Tax=Salvia splendens TaxID=180675 RepID=A0A8X8WVE5_SALSN|nr:hypothetical protein SASPL_138570 [Salvia splendens]